MNAAKLPEEYEANWIFALVRSFVLARARDANDIYDEYAQEALKAATRALAQADAKGVTGDERTGFVKCAVRSRLTDLNRRHDRRTGVVTSAEDLPREEDDDGGEHLIEERFEDSAFDRLPRRLTSDIGLALMLLDPTVRRVWRAFRDTSGSSRDIADYLGDVSYVTVQKKLLPMLVGTFANAYGAVRFIRGKSF